MFKRLDLTFVFSDFVTVFCFNGIKVAYVRAEDIKMLKDFRVDYAFILFPHNADSIAIDWSKVKMDRRRVMRRKVHSIRSYMDGNNFIPIDPSTASTEILEFKIPSGKIKVMVPTINGSCFIPHYLSDADAEVCTQGDAPVYHLMGMCFPPRPKPNNTKLVDDKVEEKTVEQASLKF